MTLEALTTNEFKALEYPEKVAALKAIALPNVRELEHLTGRDPKELLMLYRRLTALHEIEETGKVSDDRINDLYGQDRCDYFERNTPGFDQKVERAMTRHFQTEDPKVLKRVLEAFKVRVNGYICSPEIRQTGGLLGHLPQGGSISQKAYNKLEDAAQRLAINVRHNVQHPKKAEYDPRQALSRQGLSEESIDNLFNMIQREVKAADMITTDTFAGVKGNGGVGRIYDPEAGWIVFKIDAYKDGLAGKKTRKALEFIHTKAETDPLAQALAEKVPIPYETDESCVTILVEDAQNKVTTNNQTLFDILIPQLEKGLKYRTLDRLRTVALWQEVMSDCNDPIFYEEVVPTAADLGELEDRNTDPRLAKSLEKLRPYFPQWAKQFLDAENEQSTLGIYDTKPENFAGKKEDILVDIGMAKYGSEIEDSARLLAYDIDACKNPKLLNLYIQSFVDMRQALRKHRGRADYVMSPEKRCLVPKQATIYAPKAAIWAQKTGKPDFQDIVACCEALTDNYCQPRYAS
ncbi:hypothetical protein ACFL0V_05010 [Nanoarchaeota archaeon]